MPAGRITSHRYWPQLDGVRALAIAAVVAFHLGYLRGGWVGVDVFFVLSGYLITSLLRGLEARGPFAGLEGFWGRRARRLLPALLVLLGVLSLYAALGGPGLVAAQLRAPALATLFYVANWQQIVAGHGYFAQFTAPGPLQQTWSLAIEEQYYLVWPLLLGGLSWLFLRNGHRTGEKGERARRVGLVTTVAVMAAASAIWMGVAAHLLGPNRAYLGTDTRAWELLLGSVGALIWPLDERSPDERSGLWSVLGLLGLVGVAGGAALAGGPPWWVWNGGLVAIAASAGLVVLSCVRAPKGVLARALRLPPLRWLGLISYSLYLWHWPVIVLMTTDTTGLDGGALLAARLAAMTAVSAASFLLIERPLRRADWAGLGRRLRIPAFGFAAVGMAVTAVVIVVGTVAPPQASSGQVSLVQGGPSPAHRSTSTAGGVPTDLLTPTRIRLPKASSADPYRLWIFGDSVMQDSSLGVQAALGATGGVTTAVNSSFGGWGLSTDKVWPSDALAIMAQNRPQIAIATWSWDDDLALDDPSAYQRRIDDVVRLLLQHGVSLVVLLEFPAFGPNTETALQLTEAQRLASWEQRLRSQHAWDLAAQRAAAAFPAHALYLQTHELFAPNGYFSPWMRTAAGAWVRARKIDNTHFCPYGAAELGALVTADLTPVLGLGPMAPGWEEGTWINDPRYNDPAGACPADQPPTPNYRGVRIPVTASRRR